MELLLQILGMLLSPSFWMEVAVFAVIVLSLNMEYGWTGIPNFGKVAFVSMGGLAAVVTLNNIILPLLAQIPAKGPDAPHVEALREALRSGVKPGDYDYALLLAQHVIPLFEAHPEYYMLLIALSLLTATCIGGLMAIIVAYPLVRLREDYLAIVLLMLSFLLWALYTNVPMLIGGSFGIQLSIKPFRTLFGSNAQYVRLALLCIACIISLIVAEMLLNTPFGRMLRAIRDDEVAAEAMGKNAARTRLTIMTLGSVWAALGGVLYVLVYTGSIQPDTFKPEITFLWIAMMLLGGVGNNWGALLGVIAFEILYRSAMLAAPYMLSALGISWDVAQGLQGNVVNLFAGILIILLLFIRPQGVLPEKPVKTPIWRIYEARYRMKPAFAKTPLERLIELVVRRGKRSSRFS